MAFTTTIASALGVQATSESVKVPATLARQINTHNQALTQLNARMLAMLKPTLVNQKLAVSTTYYLTHGLGRPYVGYIITRFNGTPAAYGLVEMPLKLGQTKDKFIALQPVATGVYDILVF